jgi:hypothetical protein
MTRRFPGGGQAPVWGRSYRTDRESNDRGGGLAERIRSARGQEVGAIPSIALLPRRFTKRGFMTTSGGKFETPRPSPPNLFSILLSGLDF